MNCDGASVLLIASYTGSPRVWRTASALAKERFNIKILEWDRNLRLPFRERIKGGNVFRLRLRAPSGLRLVFELPLWWIYISFFLLLNHQTIVQPENLDNLLPTWIVSRIRRIRIIYDLGDFYSDAFFPGHRFLSRIARWIERTLIRRVDGLVLVTESQMDQVKRSNLPTNYTIIYNSLPDDEIDAIMTSESSSPEVRKKIRLIYAGNLGAGRFELLLNLAKALEKTENIELVVAGFGELEAIAFKTFCNIPNVRYLGFLSHREVITQTSLCDLVVLPYDPRLYNNTIGLPNKFFEALALSKPMVAQRGTHMGSIVARNRCGILTDFLDMKALSVTLRHIERIGHDKMRRMGAKGNQLYQKRYRWSLMERRLLHLYKQALRK